MKLSRLFIALTLVAGLHAQSVRFDALPLNAAPGSTTPAIASAYDGSLYVSWIEPLANNAGHTLRLAQFDHEADSWAAPRTVAAGADWFINGADTPPGSAGLRGKVVATWYVKDPSGGHAYHAVYATSEDHGQTWSPPAPITSESTVTEFVSIAPLSNGEWLTIWLDGRAHATDGPIQLRSRLLGSDETDTLIDDRVCDCCNIAPLVLPNGAILIAYRDRSDDETRDFAFQRYSRGTWSPAKAPPADGWQIAVCPVNGAHLSRRGAHVVAAWFASADDNPKVMTARSNNIGNSWNLAGQVSDPAIKPLGRVASAVTRDGSQWISWVEVTGDLALRRLGSDGVMPAIDRLPLPADNALPGPHARPRLTLLDNRSDTPARLLIARPESHGIATYIATLPLDEGAAVDDCGCGPSEAATRGHALRGQIKSILTDRNALVVAHEEIPGVMKAMTMRFQVDPRVLPLVAADQQIMARMERREDGKWWLFNIRLLNRSP
ncbi:MAG: copper-binding protein [Candidatus Synoicihabitans palmerolidicus]|nr:copper-binding protein [Candidatus Synoicihabitans palmerolidicus]